MTAFAGRDAAAGRAVLIALCTVLAVACSPAVAPAAALKPGALDPPTWSEEFPGDQLDLTTWDHRGTGPRHDGILTKDAVSVHDGALEIKTYTQDAKHYSGMISTTGTTGFEQKYGYYEARMKFNDSPGEWSAFWLQSRSVGNPLGDPGTAGVEMDIVEHRPPCVDVQHTPSGLVCVPLAGATDRVQHGLIWDGYGPDSRSIVKVTDALPGLEDDTWHTFAMSWTPTELTFYYDDAVTWSVSGPISHREQYIILSSEIGKAFAGAIPEGGYGSRETSQTNVQVDYVRVWELPSDHQAPVNLRLPAVTGDPRAGAGLTCSSGGWAGVVAPALDYQWLSDGVPIAGASTPAFAVRDADAGHGLACRVTATNPAGATSALSPALQVPVPPRPLTPTVEVAIPCTPAPCAAPAAPRAVVAVAGIAKSRLGRATQYKLYAAAATHAGGTRVAAKVRLTRKLRSVLRRALRAGRKTELSWRIRVLDGKGHTRTLSRVVRLRR